MAVGSRDVAAAAIGAMAAAVIGPILIVAWLVVAEGWGEPSGTYALPIVWLVFSFLFALVAGVSSFTLGLAWHAVAMKIGWSAWWAYGLAGLCAGAAAGAGVAAWTMGALPGGANIEILQAASTVGALTGLVMATTAWLVRRPDKKPSETPRDPAWERLTRS